MKYELREIDDLETNTVCKLILSLTENYGTAVGILVPAGTGGNLMARVRVKITRLRDKMRTKTSRKIKSFKIHSRVQDHSDEHDVLILWTSQSKRNVIAEAMEDVEIEKAMARN